MSMSDRSQGIMSSNLVLPTIMSTSLSNDSIGPTKDLHSFGSNYQNQNLNLQFQSQLRMPLAPPLPDLPSKIYPNVQVVYLPVQSQGLISGEGAKMWNYLPNIQLEHSNLGHSIVLPNIQTVNGERASNMNKIFLNNYHPLSQAMLGNSFSTCSSANQSAPFQPTSNPFFEKEYMNNVSDYEIYSIFNTNNSSYDKITETYKAETEKPEYHYHDTDIMNECIVISDDDFDSKENLCDKIYMVKSRHQAFNASHDNNIDNIRRGSHSVFINDDPKDRYCQTEDTMLGSQIYNENSNIKVPRNGKIQPYPNTILTVGEKSQEFKTSCCTSDDNINKQKRLQQKPTATITSADIPTVDDSDSQLTLPVTEGEILVHLYSI